MLDSIGLENFKCFKNQILPLKNLTLFTGGNAAGKSSALQSMLIASQWLRYYPTSARLPLNGPLVKLGNASDVLYDKSDNPCITLQFFAEKALLALELDTAQRSSNGVGVSNFADIADNALNSKFKELIFLSASRSANTETFPFPEEPEPIHANVGSQGEFAPWWFSKFMDEDISTGRLHEDEKAKILRRQLNAWGSEIFPGFEANASTLSNSSLVTLELRTKKTDTWRKPTNIGFGLSYAFPILVAGLLAQEKQILVIDSPEAHLHPRGQSKIGEFLAVMAKNGVQIILETHSDHVLNGIRLAVKKGKIQSHDVAIHFFCEQVDGESSPKISSPLIDPKGNLSEWPENFFDQSERDMSHLLGWE